MVGSKTMENMLENLKKYRLVLASNSPRRKELLAGLDVDYEVRVLPGIDESYPDGLSGEEIPKYISRKKAEAYEAIMQPDELIITADTIVWTEWEGSGKPKDEAEAKEHVTPPVRTYASGDNRSDTGNSRKEKDFCDGQ